MLVVWFPFGETDDQTIASCATILSEDEQARADRYRFEPSRRQFRATRWGLRTLLGQLIGIAPADIAFRYGTHGKPHLAGTAAGLEFSVSHTGQCAAYAFCRDQLVGIDIEEPRPRENTEGLVRRFFSEPEYRDWLSLPEAERLAAFYRGWTAKEAWLKARGTGLNFPLNHFAVPMSTCLERGLSWVHDEPGEPARWRLASLTAREDLAGSVAVLDPIGQIREVIWSGQELHPAG